MCCNQLSKLLLIGILLMCMNCSQRQYSFAKVERKYKKIKVSNKMMQKYIKDSINCAMVTNCFDHYEYKDIDKEITNSEIIYFEFKHRGHINYYPNFFICVTQKSDTIGLLDWQFDGKVNIGDKINIEAANWSQDEKQFGRPPLRMSDDLICLYCGVKIVYRGQLVK